MAKNTGTLVGAPVRPNDSNDTYPSAYSSEIKGGKKSVTDVAALYALATKPDLLEVFVTEVYVYTLGYEVRLVDIANADKAAGWLPIGDGRYLQKAGGTMTGDIDMGAKAITGQLAPGVTNKWSVGKNPNFGNLQIVSDGTTVADYSTQLIFNYLGNNTKYLNYNPTFYGDSRLKFGPNPAAGMESLAYVSDVDAAKAYAETLVVGLFDDRGNYDPTVTSLYPASGGSGAAGAIKKGDIWTVTVAGTVNAIPVDAGDTIRALSDAPGQTNSNWAISQGNVYQADETQRGIAKVATSVTVGNEASSNDTDFVTTKKLWQNFWPRMLALAQTYAAKITFTVAPRFSSVTASQYLKVDANKDLTSVSAIPAADVTESTTKRFITDSERTTWNGKQDALSIATDAEMQAGTINTKYATPLRLTSWWNWLKTQGATITVRWIFNLINLNPTTAPVTPFEGDLYVSGNTIKHYKGGAWTSVLDVNGNTDFTGTSNRALQAGTDGTISASQTILDGFITDSDIVSALTGATYNSGNRFTAVVTPASSKIMYQGQQYYDAATGYMYTAVQDNTILRQIGG